MYMTSTVVTFTPDVSDAPAVDRSAYAHSVAHSQNTRYLYKQEPRQFATSHRYLHDKIGMQSSRSKRPSTPSPSSLSMPSASDCFTSSTVMAVAWQGSCAALLLAADPAWDAGRVLRLLGCFSFAGPCSKHPQCWLSSSYVDLMGTKHCKPK